MRTKPISIVAAVGLLVCVATWARVPDAYASDQLAGSVIEEASGNRGGIGDVNVTGDVHVDGSLAVGGPGPWIDVRAYGAVGDGATDDAAAIQSAIDAVDVSTGGTVFFPPGVYYVQSSLKLPKLILVDHCTVALVGYGATLKTDQPIPILTRDKPENHSQAENNMTRLRPIIRGLRFQGTCLYKETCLSEKTRLYKQTGIELPATYGAVIEDCHFQNLGTGVDLIYAMMAVVRSSIATNLFVNGFVARSGANVWCGATVDNAGSNHTTFKSVRVFGAPGQNAQFVVRASSGVVIEDCITEGSDPVYNIFFDVDTSSTAKTFSIRNLHSENTPSGAVVRLAANGYVTIDGLWHQTAATLVDASGSTTSAVVFVRDLPRLLPGMVFRTSATTAESWVFDGCGDGDNRNISDPSFWDGGTIPIRRRITRFGRAPLENSGYLIDSVITTLTGDVEITSPGGPRFYLSSSGGRWRMIGSTNLLLESDSGGTHLVLTNEGDLAVGKAPPLAKLHVQGQTLRVSHSVPDETVEVQVEGPSGGWRISTNRASAFGDLTSLGFRTLSGNTRMVIQEDGDVGIGRTPTANLFEVEGKASKSTAGDWLANSDARIKKDVETIGSALETLLRVRPVSFRYTDDYRASHPTIADRRYVNVIAQEFAETFPAAVHGSGEFLPDGHEILQVDTHPLTIYAIAAIQELSRRLDESKAELEELAATVRAQEQLILDMQNGRAELDPRVATPR